MTSAPTFNMPHRLVHIQEALLAVILAVHAGSTHLLMAAASQSEAEALRWSLLPLMGALIASATAFLLNRDREVGRIVAGRTIFALVGGVSVPKFASLIHPSLADVITDPLILVLFGIMAALPCYFLAKPIIERLGKQAPSTADDLIDGAMHAATNRLKNIGFVAPPSVASKWPVPPVPGSPDYQTYLVMLKEENERMAAVSKQTPIDLP